MHLVVGRGNQRAAGFYRRVSATYLFGTALVFGLALQDAAALADARRCNCPDVGGRHWDRTSDLLGVNRARLSASRLIADVSAGYRPGLSPVKRI